MKRVNLNEVCKDLGIQHFPYSRYWETLPPEADKTDGMAFYRESVPTILYDDRKSAERIRFVVAHEIGHIILNHLKRPGVKRMEVQADIFAAVLIAADLLSEYGLDDQESGVKEAAART